MKVTDLGAKHGTLMIFGGPYSNLQATQAIKFRAESLGIAPANIICTGDTVAYCADPSDTVDLIRAWGIHVVQGNCEESIGEDANDCGCGFDAGSLCSVLSNDWFNYTRSRIKRVQQEWMRGLPEQISFHLGDRKMTVLHGDAEANNTFVFASDSESSKRAQLEALKSDVIIGGHCGLPFGQRIDLEKTTAPGGHIRGAWVNAGVIGMPANDGETSTWYMLINAVAGDIEFSWHRLHYDWEAAQASMEAAGLKPDYRLALASGVWPSDSVLPDAERSAQGQPLSRPAMSIPAVGRLSAFAQEAAVKV